MDVILGGGWERRETITAGGFVMVVTRADGGELYPSAAGESPPTPPLERESDQQRAERA